MNTSEGRLSGERLVNTMKVERARRDMTQEHLAELVGVTRKTINTVERGVFVPSTVLALKLARVLEVTVEELFTLEWERSKEEEECRPAPVPAAL